MSERKKIVHTLDTPYSAAEWPKVSQEDQDAILELLCQLVEPWGHHRRNFIIPSKGKRKKKQDKSIGTNNEPSSVPPLPEIAAHIDVGLSQISRTLQEMASLSIPLPPPSKTAGDQQSQGQQHSTDVQTPLAEKEKDTKHPPTKYSIIFIPRSNQSSAFHCHFPQMVALASSSFVPLSHSSPSEPIRLVGFSARHAEEKLSAALGIPRVSSIALHTTAPARQTKALLDFVRERVPPVEIAWLQEVTSGKFRETKIEAVPTKIGTTNKKKAKENVNKKQKTS